MKSIVKTVVIVIGILTLMVYSKSILTKTGKTYTSCISYLSKRATVGVNCYSK